MRCNLVSCGLSQESLLQIWRRFWSDGRKKNLMKLETITLFWSLNINGYCWEWGVIELKKMPHLITLIVHVWHLCDFGMLHTALSLWWEQYVNGTTIVGSCKCTFTLLSQYNGFCHKWHSSLTVIFISNKQEKRMTFVMISNWNYYIIVDGLR